MSFRLASPIALALALGLTAPAQAMADPSQLCRDAALQAATEEGVPTALMLAITQVETARDGRPWPWALNIEGAGSWHPDAPSAIAAAQRAETGAQVDVGCFQLNTRWHGEAFPDLATMMDPLANARHAARFLAALQDELGSWKAAAAAYHSRTPALGAAYLERLEAAHDQAIARNSAPVDPTDAPPPRRTNRFPLLLAGGAGAPGSLVPQAGRGIPLIGGP